MLPTRGECPDLRLDRAITSARARVSRFVFKESSDRQLRLLATFHHRKSTARAVYSTYTFYPLLRLFLFFQWSGNVRFSYVRILTFVDFANLRSMRWHLRQRGINLTSDESLEIKRENTLYTRIIHLLLVATIGPFSLLCPSCNILIPKRKLQGSIGIDKTNPLRCPRATYISKQRLAYVSPP